jgi:hypothetical protein
VVRPVFFAGETGAAKARRLILRRCRIPGVGRPETCWRGTAAYGPRRVRSVEETIERKVFGGWKENSGARRCACSGDQTEAKDHPPNLYS